LNLFKNEDLDDVIKPHDDSEIDISLKNLRSDPHKSLYSYRKKRDDVVVSLDP
jgi:hypothetical protein